MLGRVVKISFQMTACAASFTTLSSKLLEQRDAGSTFGPGNCVALSRSEMGTCVISTSCGTADLSAVEFAFVCHNPGTMVPHALHSFGKGKFEPSEVFDSGVKCGRCLTVENALEGGSAMNWGRSSHLGNLAPPDGVGDVRALTPSEAAFYGPQACIAAFRSPAGTCIVQTRCSKADISHFDVGITCLDKSGDYTRYLFGKGGFEQEETFDTRIECEVCLGVGAESGQQQVHGILPKQLVEDVNNLKQEIEGLKNEMLALKSELHGSRGGAGAGAGAGGQQGHSGAGDTEVLPAAEQAKKDQMLKEALAGAPAAVLAPGSLAPAPSMAAAPGGGGFAWDGSGGAEMVAAPAHAQAPGESMLTSMPTNGNPNLQHMDQYGAASPPTPAHVEQYSGASFAATEPYGVQKAAPGGALSLHDLFRRLATPGQ